MLGGAFYAHTHFREYSIQSARDDYFKQRVKVTVAFCDEWSYLPKAKNLIWAIQDEFEEYQEQLYVSTKPLSGKATKGHFEVYVNDELIHSKNGGDGVVDTRQKLNKITLAIEKELDKIK